MPSLTMPRTLSQRQKLLYAAAVICKPCCGSGEGSGSGSGSGSGGVSYSCEEAGNCFSQVSSTVYGSVDVGDCQIVIEHGTSPVDPDPPQWGWFPAWDITVLGFGSYYEYQDADSSTGGCDEDSLVNYSVICVDRASGSTLAVIAWYTDGTNDWYYYIDTFETISCDPFYIDTGYASSTDPSGGPSFRLVLST